MEVSSKEEANARLQAAHIEEVSALANDVKGLKVNSLLINLAYRTLQICKCNSNYTTILTLLSRVQ